MNVMRNVLSLVAIWLLSAGVRVHAHGTHSIGEAAPLSDAEHGLVHLGEWALLIIAGLVILGAAFRIFKKRF